jgi:hypothetical protein
MLILFKFITTLHVSAYSVIIRYAEIRGGGARCRALHPNVKGTYDI